MNKNTIWLVHVQVHRYNQDERFINLAFSDYDKARAWVLQDLEACKDFWREYYKYRDWSDFSSESGDDYWAFSPDGFEYNSNKYWIQKSEVIKGDWEDMSNFENCVDTVYKLLLDATFITTLQKGELTDTSAKYYANSEYKDDYVNIEISLFSHSIVETTTIIELEFKGTITTYSFTYDEYTFIDDIRCLIRSHTLSV